MSLLQNTSDENTQWLVQKFGGTSVGKFALEIATQIVPCAHPKLVSCVSLHPPHSTYIHQHKLALVFSARSGSTKALGTTNLLLRATSQVRQRTSKPTSGSQTPVSGSNSLFRRSRSSSGIALSTSFAMTPTSTTPGDNCTQPSPEFATTVQLIRSEHLSAARESIKDPDILQELEDEISSDCDWLNSYLFAAQVCTDRVHSHFLTQNRSSMKYHLAQGIISSGLVNASHASS